MEKGLEVWSRSQRCYWNVEFEKLDIVSSNEACHIAKIKCRNYNKRRCIKPHSYPWSMKKKTHHSHARRTTLKLKACGGPRAKGGRASIEKPTHLRETHKPKIKGGNVKPPKGRPTLNYLKKKVWHVVPRVNCKSTLVWPTPFCNYYLYLPCINFGVVMKIMVMAGPTFFLLHIVVILKNPLSLLVHCLLPSFFCYQSFFFSRIFAIIIHCYCSISTPHHHHLHFFLALTKNIPNYGVVVRTMARDISIVTDYQRSSTKLCRCQ